jgi:excisionase family DNA binding protein
VSATATPQLLTAEQLARRWQVPPSHAYRLTREGRIPVVKLGRYYRYRPDAIDHLELRGLDEPPERHSRRALKRSDALAPGAMTDLPRSPGPMSERGRAVRKPA